MISSFQPTSTYHLMSIVDGFPCSVKGHGSTTPSLTVHDVHYVPSFPTNLLSINVTTYSLNYVGKFNPFHCDLHPSHKRFGA